MERLIALHRQPNFRSEKWVRVSELTRQFVHRLYDKGETFDDEAIELYFPERFLNYVELSTFLDKLQSSIPKCKFLIVHTHSEVIVRLAWGSAIEVGEVTEELEPGAMAETYSAEIPGQENAQPA